MEFAATIALVLATSGPAIVETALGSPATPARTAGDAGAAVSQAPADPYRGVPLGVECAWPAVSLATGAGTDALLP